jgi:hypothetical protein
MPPVPPACQALADQVAVLEQQYVDKATQASGLVGQDAWAALGSLGALRDQLTQARVALDQCVKTHAATLTGNVVVLDAGASVIGAAQTATLWDLTDGGGVARQSVPVQADAFGFDGPLPARAAITLQPSPSPEVTGLDFRSGELPGSPEAQTPRIEIVVLPEVTIPADRLRSWAAGFAGISRPVMVNQSSGQFTLSGLTVALSTGMLAVSANGSVSGSLAGVPIPPTPFAATVSVQLAPSVAPQPSDIVSVGLATANPVSLAMPAFPAALVPLLSSMLSPFVSEVVRTSMGTWVQQILPQRVANGLALAQLPPGTGISLRRLTVDERGITIQPVLGTIGTALSTFKPSPLSADASTAPALVSFTLAPDSVPDSNPVTTLTVAVAQPATSDLDVEIFSLAGPDATAPFVSIIIPAGGSTATQTLKLPDGIPDGNDFLEARLGDSTLLAPVHVVQ